MKSKKSKEVTLLIVTSIAAGILAACGGASNAKACVDKDGAVVDASYCENRSGVGGAMPFLWYYGGFYNSGRAYGGSYQPTSGASYNSVTTPSVARGGLGTSASGGKSSSGSGSSVGS